LEKIDKIKYDTLNITDEILSTYLNHINGLNNQSLTFNTNLSPENIDTLKAHISKIRSLLKLRNKVIVLFDNINKHIATSNTNIDNIDNISFDITNEIYNKLIYLQNNNFIFTQEDVYNFMDLSWSKHTFGLEGSFAIQADNEIINPDNIYEINNYWPKILVFGPYKLRFNNQWNSEIIRSKFTNWYSSLFERIDYEISEEPVNNKNYLIYVSFIDQKIIFNNLEDAIIHICELMILNKPYKCAKLPFSPLSMLNDIKLFSYIESEIDGTRKKLSNNVFIYIPTDEEKIMSFTKHIVKLCDYSESDFNITISSE
jgi:molybdopterin converting factor small subunit